MELRYVDFDARLDEVQSRFWDLTEARRQHWATLEHAAWLYHELQLEGVSVRTSDIVRANEDEQGVDYCDRVLLEQIRRTDRLLKIVRQSANDGQMLSVATLRGWVALLNAQDSDVAFRTKEGPTEHYKHDVLPPEQILEALQNTLEYARSEDRGHPLEVACELLYTLGKIWPFTAWSGMCARLAASFVLISAGYPQLILPTRERMNYYQAYHHEPSRMKDLFLQAMDGILTSKNVFIEGRDLIDTLGSDVVMI